MWLYSKYGKADKCENKDCTGKSSVYNWALKSGKEYEKNRDNFIMLCTSCHRIYDENLISRKNKSKAQIGNTNGNKEVMQYNPKNGEFTVYSSISEAVKEFNILPTSISNCLNGRAKTAGGYVWKYLN